MLSCLQVHLVWPIIYCVCTLFLVIVPLWASPVETGSCCLLRAEYCAQVSDFVRAVVVEG